MIISSLSQKFTDMERKREHPSGKIRHTILDIVRGERTKTSAFLVKRLKKFYKNQKKRKKIYFFWNKSVSEQNIHKQRHKIMKKFRQAALLAMMILVAGATFSQTGGDRILGTYYMKTPDTGDESKVQIYKTSSGTYCGKVVWVKNPNNSDGTPRRDEKNPDPKLRNRTADNLLVMKNLKYDDGEWVNGDLYNPNEGKWFKIKVNSIDSKGDLDVRYYKGITLLGKSDTWKRVK